MDSTSDTNLDAIASVLYHNWFYMRARLLMTKGFADVIIVDITAGQKNHCFTEIAPHTLYPLYGIDILV